MNITDVHAEGTLSLAELETLLHQQETLNGPLVNLGNAGPNTVLTFNLDELPPAQATILRLTPGGVTPAVTGHTLVCQGNCLIGGQLTGVAALRATSVKSSVPVVVVGSALEQALLATLPAALQYKDIVSSVALANQIAPEVVAAIGSVESDWGTSALMQPNGPAGTGDRKPRSPKPPLRPGTMPPDGLGYGRGLMQIDWDSHEFARIGNWWDARENIEYSCHLLATNRNRFMAQGSMSDADALMAAVAAYNAGFGGVSRKIGDTGLKSVFEPGTYAAKVLTRVSFFRSNGFAAGAVVASMPALTPGEGPFVAANPGQFLTVSVGDGECVAFVRKAANAPHTSTWTRGAPVKGHTDLVPRVVHNVG